MIGQLTDAQGYLDEGMRRWPDSAFGHVLLASLDLRAGKYQQAENALRRAIQLGPTMAQARLQLVNLMLQQEKSLEAVDQLREDLSREFIYPESQAAITKARSRDNRVAGAKLKRRLVIHSLSAY